MKRKLKMVFMALITALACFAGALGVYASPLDSVSEIEFNEMCVKIDEAELENWLISSGAIYNQRFSSTPIDSFYQPPTEKTKAKMKESLAGPAWSVNNKDELEETIFWLITEGHNAEFMDLALQLSALEDSEYKSLVSRMSKTDKKAEYMLPLIKDIYKRFGDGGILAWDLFRAALLVEWGYEAGYLTLDEVYEWMRPIAVYLKLAFSDWDEACQNYLMGYCYWARINPEDKDTEYKARVQAYNEVKAEHKDLFDDDLFSK